MKRRLAFIFAALLMATVAFLAWWGPWESSLPGFDRATVSFLGQPEDQEVELPFAQREQLHDLLSGVLRDWSPKKWQVFCTVRLHGATGRQVAQVEVFSNPRGQGPLQIGENYFLGYDQTAFRELVSLPSATSGKGG